MASERKAPAKRMSDDKLVALIEERESKASKSGTYHEDTAKALRYYLGGAFGNEVEGQSQVVMREVYSTIEWIKPALLRMFFGGDQVVKFVPKGPEDIKQAEQETDVVHHCVVNQNDGFATLYTWFTDALLSRNAYVVAYWDEREDTTESMYRGLSLAEATILLDENDVEVIEASEYADPMGEPVFDVRVRMKERQGKVCIETLPPERVLVEARYKHIGLSRAGFVEYWEEKTISELREAGFDVPDSLADEDDDEGAENGRDIVENARMLRDERVVERDDDDADPASRVVKVRTVFMRVDRDGDGIAEMHRIVVVGKTILSDEVYDRVLMAALTPTIMPHRHVGMSVADAVMDLQEIKSTLMRGLLDNMYLANNGRHAINEETVNLDDLLTTRPGGIVRVAGDPGAAIVPLVTPALGAPIIQTIEYMDQVLENRTGASPRVLQGQGVDGNAINKTATGINTVMSAAMARIELIARVFAETGVKELFQIVHTLLLKHGRKREVMRLRNQFIPVDPREWQKRTDMSVEVGLGTGDKQAKIALLQMLAAAQQGLAAAGLSTPQTMFNTLSKIVAEAGYKDPEEFFVNPAKPGYAPPQAPQDPTLIAKQAELAAKAQADAQRNQLDALKIRADWQKSQLAAQVDQARVFLDAQVKVALAMMDQDATASSKRTEENTKLALAGVNERGQTAAPRRKLVRHIRGPDDRIVASEITEIDDEVQQ